MVILRLSRDPAQFIADGDAAWAAQDYKSADRNYRKAYGLTRSSQDKVSLLFKLEEVHKETADWRKVLACWEQIITLDPQNLRARLGRLKYGYVLADSLSSVGQGSSGHWNEVRSQTGGLIKLVEATGLLDEPKATLEPPFGAAEEPGWDGGATFLGSYLYFVKGRAALELASLGAATSPDELLGEAENDLQKAKKLDPNNTDVYRYLAEVLLEKGEKAVSRGSLDEKDRAERRADEILAEGVSANSNRPEAYISLLTRKLTLARRGGTTAVREQMQALEPEYQALVERFPSSAEAFDAVAEFHTIYSAYSGSEAAADRLGRAIEAAEKAGALDKSSVVYPRLAAILHNRRFSLYGDETALSRAIALAEGALELPDAQDTPGPRQYAKQANRLSVCSFLARCYVGRILALGKSAPGRDAMLAKAEKAVHEIETIRGSGENPQVVMWQGMLELARGHTSNAIRGLYTAYEQIRASNPSGETDPFLSYTLAEIFKGTAEIGAVIEFLGSALNSGIMNTKPESLLDYGEALLQARSHDTALSFVNTFDERFGRNDRSRMLRVQVLIAKGHVSEAEEAVAALNSDDPNTVRLRLDLARAKTAQLRAAIRQEESGDGSSIEFAEVNANDEADQRGSAEAMAAELRDYERREVDLVQRLLKVDPGAVEEKHLAALCEMLIAQDNIVTAREIVSAFLKHSPDSPTALVCQGLLSEPDPSNLSADRRRAIEEAAIRRIADPVRRALELGVFCQKNEKWDEAVSQWRDVLDATASQGVREEPAYLRAKQLSPRHVAASHLFDITRLQKDWPLAEEIVEIAKKDNLDDCGGHLFAGRLAFAKGENEDALAHLDECLRQRPIFSYGYMLRGNVQAVLGNQHASVEDQTKAAGLNPTDPLVAKAFANALYVRNSRLGDNVSSEQRIEAKRAMERAIQLDPRDTNLLMAYAEFISESEPLKALALRQRIQTNGPTLHNAVMLGKLATRIALKETDQARKRSLFAIAESAFEQARQMDPNNQFMLESYAEYYRARQQNEKAQQLLVESQDSRLLWRHYFRVGRYNEAKKLLAQMYNEQADKVDALKGLVLVAEHTGDKDGVKQYSEELLSLEDSLINRLAQIRAYLDVGLVTEAERKLQSFREKYPEEPHIGLMEALLAKRQGQLERALELTNRNLQTDQQNAAAWRLRGEICFLMGDYDRAIPDFRKSRALEDDPITVVALAKAYAWAGRDEEAITELEGVLDRPGTPMEARALLESIYLRLGRDGALKQLYADTLTQFPDSVEWLGRTGAFAIAQGQYGEAEKSYERAYRLKQQDSSDRAVAEAVRDVQYAAVLDGYLRALILGAGEPTAGSDAWHPEKLDKLFQEGQKYIDTVYAAVAFYRMAEAKKKLGDSAAVGDYCRKAMDKAWANERLAMEVLQRVYLLIGGEEVSQYCQKRLQTNPDSLAANFTMFNLAKIKGEYDDAVDYIDKCVRLCDPQTQQHVQYMAKKAQILTLAYKQTSDNGYLEKAIAVYESLLAKMPKNSNVLNNLAYMLAQSDQRLPEALGYAKRAIEQDPDEANYLDTYAYVLYKNGRTAEAAQFLAAAIQQYGVEGGAPAEAYEHLGMVNEALGENKKAIVAYRRALEIGASTMPDTVKDRISSAIARLAP